MFIDGYKPVKYRVQNRLLIKIHLAMILVIILIIIILLSIIHLQMNSQKRDFKKYSRKNESYERFCKRYYSHYIK